MIMQEPNQTYDKEVAIEFFIQACRSCMSDLGEEQGSRLAGRRGRVMPNGGIHRQEGTGSKIVGEEERQVRPFRAAVRTAHLTFPDRPDNPAMRITNSPDRSDIRTSSPKSHNHGLAMVRCVGFGHRDWCQTARGRCDGIGARWILVAERNALDRPWTQRTELSGRESVPLCYRAYRAMCSWSWISVGPLCIDPCHRQG